MHLVELNDDVRGRCDLLHDPLSLKLIDEEQEFLCGRTAKCTKQVRDEALVGVGRCARLSVNLLENGDHLGGRLTYIILVFRPEGDLI